MKTTVHFSIDKNTRFNVKTGEKIEKGTPIGEVSQEEEESIIPIAELLCVKPVFIAKYLKKRIGEKVSAGMILARKKSFLSLRSVKCPVSGRIKEIDLKKGTLTISQTFSKKGLSKREKIILPVSGKIKSITKAFIEVEIEGEIARAKSGSGRETTGEIFYLEGDSVGVLDIPAGVKGRIIVCHSLLSGAIVKLEVLEASGLIVQKMQFETDLIWIEVSEDVLKKLSSYDGKTAWLRPEEKEIIICL